MLTSIKKALHLERFFKTIKVWGRIKKALAELVIERSKFDRRAENERINAVDTC